MTATQWGAGRWRDEDEAKRQTQVEQGAEAEEQLSQQRTVTQ